MSGWIGWKPSSFDPKVASSRLRCLRVLSELQSRGYSVELFDPLHVKRYAAVVYSKVYDDASYHEAVVLQRKGARIIFDLCDNHFYNPRNLNSWREASERLRRMMTLADALVASTATLADVMKRELPAERSIAVIGDPVETEIENCHTPVWMRWLAFRQLAAVLSKLRVRQAHGRTPLVWFGNHGSPYAEGGMLDLQKIRPALERLNRQHPISLTVISNSRWKYQRAIKPWAVPTDYLTWHPATFLCALRAHAIAVIPISANPFTICKSNNRLALALNEGLAVVADLIPSYRSFAAACYLGDWETGLHRYLSDPHLRNSHVALGKAMVNDEWTVARIADQWQTFFDAVLVRGKIPLASHLRAAKADF
jgi:hypothetical protein